MFSRICGLHQPRQKSFSDLLMVPVSFVGASTGLTTGFISSSHVKKLTGNLYKILRPVSSFLIDFFFKLHFSLYLDNFCW